MYTQFCYTPKRIEECLLKFILKYNSIKLFDSSSIEQVLEYAWWSDIRHDSLKELNRASKALTAKFPVKCSTIIEIGKPIKLKVETIEKWKKKKIDLDLRQLMHTYKQLEKIKSVSKSGMLRVARASSYEVLKHWKKESLYLRYYPIVSSAEDGSLLYSWKLQKKLLEGYAEVCFPSKDRMGRKNWVGEEAIFRSIGINIRFDSNKIAKDKSFKKQKLPEKLKNYVLIDSKFCVGKIVGKVAFIPLIELEGKIKGFKPKRGYRLEHYIMLAALEGIEKPIRCVVEPE